MGVGKWVDKSSSFLYNGQITFKQKKKEGENSLADSPALTKLKSFKSNVQFVLRTLKEKPENHPGRTFLAEALNALLEQEYDAEFEIVVPSSQARRELIQLMDLAKKLKDFGIQVSLELVDGSVEDEKVILCTLIAE